LTAVKETPRLFHFARRRLTGCVAGGASLAGFQKLLCSTAIEALGNPCVATQFGDEILADGLKVDLDAVDILSILCSIQFSILILVTS
jgi:hypothetical protein